MTSMLPTRYQPNRRRLWISWRLVPEATKPKLDKYKAVNKYGCYLPNTRRFRKLIRGILRDRYQGNAIPTYGAYDLCFDPGVEYIYSNYDLVLGVMAEQWAHTQEDIHSLIGQLLRPDKDSDAQPPTA